MKKLLKIYLTFGEISHIITFAVETVIDAWLSLVERCVRDAEAAGSNPVASIFLYNRIRQGYGFSFFKQRVIVMIL